MRLVRVELRRLGARRLTRMAAVGVLLLTAISLYGTQQEVWNATPERVAQVQAQMQQDCLGAQSQARQSDPTADFGCSSLSSGAPTGADTVTFVDAARSSYSSLAYLLAFLAFVVGTTFVAAEFSTGSLAMWLTYEPRRGRVYASKLTAVLGGVLAVAALTLGVAAGAAYLLTRHYGLENTSARAGGGQLWGDALRTITVVAAAGLLGSAVATLLRHTAAALGVLIGYVVVVEVLLVRGLSFLVGDPRPWLLLSNVTAWLQGGLAGDTPPDCFDPSKACPPPAELIGTGQAGLYLLGLTALAIALGAVVFRRRDVT